jgi:hypothetical protein
MWILEVINILQQMDVHSNVDEMVMGSMGRFYNVWFMSASAASVMEHIL